MSGTGNTVAIAALVLLSACVTPRKDSRGVLGAIPGSVAVLPFDNETTSLKGSEIVRELVWRGVRRRGYGGPSREEIDGRLQGIGITDGGQLPAADPGKIGDALGVDGLLYGSLEQFTYQNVGFLVRKAVRLKLRLILASTGETVYESVGAGQKSRVVLDEKRAKRSFVHGLADQAVETAVGKPLIRESRLAVRRALRRLPRR